MKEVAVQITQLESPSKKRNDVAIELVSGSVGGACQVLVGQVSLTIVYRRDAGYIFRYTGSPLDARGLSFPIRKPT